MSNGLFFCFEYIVCHYSSNLLISLCSWFSYRAFGKPSQLFDRHFVQNACSISDCFKEVVQIRLLLSNISALIPLLSVSVYYLCRFRRMDVKRHMSGNYPFQSTLLLIYEDSSSLDFLFLFIAPFVCLNILLMPYESWAT